MDPHQDIPQPAKRSPAHRSRVANGSKLLPLTDGRSATARRFRDLFEDICGDLGGAAHLSEGQRQLVRRAAMLSAESERLEAMAARGEAAFDIDLYGMLVFVPPSSAVKKFQPVAR
jgi:hypothetical protein